MLLLNSAEILPIMPPSQLKRLKASIHEQRTARQNHRQKRSPQGPQRNGFPSRKPSRPKTLRKETAQQKAHRLRQERLLPELQRRHKVGGIVDRRIGENDPTLAPEERMLQRYAMQNQRSKRRDAFNLEGEGEEDAGILTHLGRPLSEQTGTAAVNVANDYDEGDAQGGALDDEEREVEAAMEARRKRKLEEAVDEYTREEAEQPARKKSRKEIMEEVIKKSKLHKHERRQAKDDDDDVREELDKELPGLLAALKGNPAKTGKVSMTLSNGVDTSPQQALEAQEQPANGHAKSETDLDYDRRIRLLAMDQRAKPTQRIKTEEQKADEEGRRLERLEEDRLRRMRGEQDDESGGEGAEEPGVDATEERNSEEDADEAAPFGLRPAEATQKPSEVGDEDDFLIDEDLVASGSDIDTDFSSVSGDEEAQSMDGRPRELGEDDLDTEFLQAVMPAKANDKENAPEAGNAKSHLAFTYPCPRTHDELLSVMRPIPFVDQPIVVQRIRALYHPQLAAGNKAKLQNFATSLVDYAAHLPLRKPAPPLPVIEGIIRHIHSLSRAYALPIAEAFRRHLRAMQVAQSTPTGNPAEAMNPGALTILTAISTIYPTSDHFHPVVTPAMTLMGRWLGTTSFPVPPSPTQNPKTLLVRDQDRLTIDAISRAGAYLTALCARYQRLSRRYVPETLRFTLAALSDPIASLTPSAGLVAQHVANLSRLLDLWRDKSAFQEMFSPAVPVLQRLSRRHAQQNQEQDRRPRSPAVAVAVAASAKAEAKALLRKLRSALSASQLARRPVLLHDHAPIPIPSTLPRLEADAGASAFHPAHRNDPDDTRAEAARLRREHRKEKKGAMRELRRDADFVAREKLRARREGDEVARERERRLVAGVQNEEGRERREYERVRARRRGARF